MKRNGLIVLSLTAAIGVAIFWSQQRPTETAVHDLDKVAVSSKTAEKQTQAPSFRKKVDVAANSHAKKDSAVAPPMTREEVIKTARLKALKDSGLEKRMQEKKRLVEARLEQIRANQTSEIGHNERVNKRLNIDVKEKFGVDFETRMAEVQVQRQRKDSAELKKHLEARGVDAVQLEEILAMRNRVLDIGNNAK